MIAQSLSTKRIRVRDGASAGTEATPDFLFENLVCDLHWTALHAGIVCSLLTAWTKPGAGWTLRSWRHVFIHDGQVMELALKFGAEMGLSDRDISALAGLYGQLASAQRLADPLSRARRDNSDEEREIVTEATDAWRRLARSAKEILHGLEHLIERRLGSHFFEDSRTLAAFLQMSISGVAEIGALGEIKVPVLHQRRGAPRMKSGGACRLIVDGSVTPAALSDISRSGIGLRCRIPPRLNSVAIVECPDGRRLTGTIIRQDGDSVGVRLAQPLRANDPLFA